VDRWFGIFIMMGYGGQGVWYFYYDGLRWTGGLVFLGVSVDRGFCVFIMMVTCRCLPTERNENHSYTPIHFHSIHLNKFRKNLRII